MEFFSGIAFFAAAQGIFLALGLAFVRGEARFENRILAFLILLYSFWLAEFAAYFPSHLYRIPHLLYVTNGFPLLFGPLLLFYTMSAGRIRDKAPWWRHQSQILWYRPIGMYYYNQFNRVIVNI